jgi:hypothetical protein
MYISSCLYWHTLFIRGVNPVTTGVGGNISLPPPLQLEGVNAPVPPVLIPLGRVTQRGTDVTIVSSPILPAAGNGTGNEEKGETPLTSVADLADNFQKILRSQQEGSSPELKNQSPQEKCLRALSTLDDHSLMRM